MARRPPLAARGATHSTTNRKAADVPLISQLAGHQLAAIAQDAATYETAKSAASAPGAEWLPIETAPRDGTLVFLLVDFDYGPDVRGGAWVVNRLSVISPGYDGYSGPGWVDVENGWVNFEDRGVLGWRPATITAASA